MIGLVARLLLAALFTGSASPALAQTGLELMEDAIRKQAPPAHVFEEQVLVLSDTAGQHTVRTARFYLRSDAAGTRRLMVIDTPQVLRGVRVYVSRDASGVRRGPAACSARTTRWPISRASRPRSTLTSESPHRNSIA